MIIAIANSKGGVGKSTVAVHLAAWLHRLGHRVTLADCDTQHSSSEWIRLALPNVQAVCLDSPDDVLNELPRLAEEADYVVADGPGSQTEMSRALLLRADFAIVPCKASMLEVRALAAKLEEEAKRIRSGLIPRTESNVKSLDDALTAFKQQLLARDTSERHVNDVIRQVRRVIDGCRFQVPADVNLADVELFLSSLRGERFGKTTYNHHVGAMKHFCKWMHESGYLATNPLVRLKKINASTDSRHPRRALEPSEYERLIEAAEEGAPIESIPGRDRSMMYQLAAWTGYRKGEIGSLTASSFELGDDPTVTVEAAYSKRRRRDTQVLHPRMASRVKEWIAGQGIRNGASFYFPFQSGRVPSTARRPR